MVLALNLGGTIALSYINEAPVTLSGSQVLGSDVLRLKEIDPVQSYALEWSHLLRLRQELVAADASGERKFLVLTGTDSVEDLIYFLDMVRPAAARIVVMVAMRTASPSNPRPDGLDDALGWLAAESPGIALCWGAARIIEGSSLEKVWDQNWHFRPMEWTQHLAPWKIGPQAVLDAVMPAVPILPVGIGSGKWHARCLHAGGFDGLVIEAYASGDVPPETAAALVEIVKAGRPVVLTSRSRPGRIKAGFPGLTGTSHELLEQGLIGAAQLDPHRARLRLALALSCKAQGEVQRAFLEL